MPIEQIDERDEVWSKPEGEANHPGGWKAVEETFERLGRVWLLRVRGQEIRTTGEHPFYVVDRGWIEAANLAAGDVLLTKEGGYVGVESCEDTGEFEVVYNLRVEEWHTYFVGDEGWDWGVWSHNTHHCAQAKHVDSSGNTVSKMKAQSGGYKVPASQTNSWKMQAASHTEVKFAKHYKDKLKPGDTLTIEGSLPPCRSYQ